MNPSAMWIAALLFISVAGVVLWAWFALSEFEKQVSSLHDFEGADFQIGPQAAKSLN